MPKLPSKDLQAVGLLYSVEIFPLLVNSPGQRTFLVDHEDKGKGRFGCGDSGGKGGRLSQTRLLHGIAKASAFHKHADADAKVGDSLSDAYIKVSTCHMRKWVLCSSPAGF